MLVDGVAAFRCFETLATAYASLIYQGMAGAVSEGVATIQGLGFRPDVVGSNPADWLESSRKERRTRLCCVRQGQHAGFPAPASSFSSANDFWPRYGARWRVKGTARTLRKTRQCLRYGQSQLPYLLARTDEAKRAFERPKRSKKAPAILSEPGQVST